MRHFYGKAGRAHDGEVLADGGVRDPRCGRSGIHHHRGRVLEDPYFTPFLGCQLDLSVKGRTDGLLWYRKGRAELVAGCGEH